MNNPLEAASISATTTSIFQKLTMPKRQKKQEDEEAEEETKKSSTKLSDLDIADDDFEEEADDEDRGLDFGCQETNSASKKEQPLSATWNLWAHLPHDTNWELDSYKKIGQMRTVEDAVAMTEFLPDIMIQNCMLFVMRDKINPTWEDPLNREGGCFSYKVVNKHVPSVWRKLTYALLGNTLTNRGIINNTFNGITISPKRNFCIIKIWTAGCLYQNPDIILPIEHLSSQGCLFKKHGSD